MGEVIQAFKQQPDRLAAEDYKITSVTSHRTTPFVILGLRKAGDDNETPEFIVYMLRPLLSHAGRIIDENRLTIGNIVHASIDQEKSLPLPYQPEPAKLATLHHVSDGLGEPRREAKVYHFVR